MVLQKRFQTDFVKMRSAAPKRRRHFFISVYAVNFETDFAKCQRQSQTDITQANNIDIASVNFGIFPKFKKRQDIVNAVVIIHHHDFIQLVVNDIAFLDFADNRSHHFKSRQAFFHRYRIFFHNTADR